MNATILQIIVAVSASAIIALGTWAIKVHSQLIELKTWKEFFQAQSEKHYEQIHEMLSEMRADIKKISEKK